MPNTQHTHTATAAAQCMCAMRSRIPANTIAAHTRELKAPQQRESKHRNRENKSNYADNNGQSNAPN